MAQQRNSEEGYAVQPKIRRLTDGVGEAQQAVLAWRQFILEGFGINRTLIASNRPHFFYDAPARTEPKRRITNVCASSRRV
jgi:hypothetical protein